MKLILGHNFKIPPLKVVKIITFLLGHFGYRCKKFLRFDPCKDLSNEVQMKYELVIHVTTLSVFL